jgi:hypothetical protein
MNKSAAFIKSLPITASVLAKRFGIKITFSGNRAYTNGKVINFPTGVITSTSALTDREIQLLRGYLDHEASHIACNSGTFDICGTAFFRYIWNILQDGRDERLFSQMFPGAKKNLIYLALEIQKYKGEQLHEASQAVTSFLTFFVRLVSFGMFKEEVHLLREQVDGLLGNDMRLEIEAEAQKGVFAQTTVEVIAAARRIVDMLQQIAEQEPEQQQSPDPEQDEVDPGKSYDEPDDVSGGGESSELGESENSSGDDGDAGPDASDEDTDEDSDVDDAPDADQDESSGNDDGGRSDPGASDEDSDDDFGEGESSELGKSENSSGDDGDAGPDASDEDTDEDSDVDDAPDADQGESSGNDNGGRSDPSASDENSDDDFGEGNSFESGEIETSSGDDDGTRGDEYSSETDELQPAAEPVAGDIASAAKSILEDDYSEIDPLGDLVCVPQIDFDFRGVPTAIKLDPSFGINSLDNYLVSGTTVALRTKLLGLLQSQERKKTLISSRGKLLGNRLYKLATGDPRMFAKSQDVESKRIAVHLLVDVSGSMSSKTVEKRRSNAYTMWLADDIKYQKHLVCPFYLDSELALASAQSFAEVVRNMPQVNLGVTAFPAKGCNNVYTLLGHGQKLERSPKWNLAVGGTTPLAEAVWHCFFQLAQLLESRKVLIILTDGEPDSVTSAQNAINVAVNSGIEVVGLALRDDSLLSLLPKENCSLIAKSQDIAPAFFSILERLLIKRRKIA